MTCLLPALLVLGMHLGSHWCGMGPAVRCLGAGRVLCGKVSGNAPSTTMVQDKGAGWAGSGESIAMVDLSANRLFGGLLAMPNYLRLRAALVGSRRVSGVSPWESRPWLDYLRLRAALVVPKGEWSATLESPTAELFALASGARGP